MGLTSGYAHYPASMAAILEFAWDTGVFRADHVIAALGLTRSTTLSALDKLIEIGLIRELTDADKGGRMGRPARRFELRGDAGLVIGIDAGGHHFTAAAADLAGRVIARERVEVPSYHDAAGAPDPEPDPDERRATAFKAIDAVLAAAGGRRADVIGIGVGIPAPVNSHGTSPPHRPNFWPRMNADLRDTLAEEFPAVRVENDAGLAALAEGSRGEARKSDHFVAMLVGRRLGSGVFMDGHLVRGAHGGIGELEGLSYVSGVGGAWGLGYRVEEWFQAALSEGRIPADHAWARLTECELTAEAVLAEARLSDPVARPLLEDLGDRLGRICSVVSRFYDPDLIIVCGAMAQALHEVIQLAREHLAQELELPAPEILPSGMGGNVVSLGAVSAAREAAKEIILPLLTERYDPLG